jgi:hypothetical protein
LQNLNSDFTDSALGSTDKSPLPYGNFQLRESTMQSILNNPKYGPRSELGTNMFTYLKFGLPRVLPPGKADQVKHNKKCTIVNVKDIITRFLPSRFFSAKNIFDICYKFLKLIQRYML